MFRLVFVYVALITDFFFLKCIYRALFIIDLDSVFCETGTEFPYKLLWIKLHERNIFGCSGIIFCCVPDLLLLLLLLLLFINNQKEYNL
jgi:hypothetical protein